MTFDRNIKAAEMDDILRLKANLFVSKLSFNATGC